MLDLTRMQGYLTRGAGLDWQGRLAALGPKTVIEDGVRVFHPEHVRIGDRAFIGHCAILDGYHRGGVEIGDGAWIGAFSFLHGAGGIRIGRAVGIGPGVKILTSQHDPDAPDLPVLHAPLRFAPVVIDDGADLGAGAIVLPGVTIGQGAVVGAGAVVTRDVEVRAVVAGNPARPIRKR